MYTGVRLVDGDREMQLLNRSDIAKLELDVPLPAVNEDVELRTDSDGSIDHTSTHGSRAVSIGLRGIDDGVDAVVAELGYFMHPARRPYLAVTHTDWIQERRLRLRASQGGAPQAGPLYPYARDVQAQWVAPEGVWEAAQPTEFVINADAGTAGRVYPMRTPRTYPTAATSGVVLHNNVGTTYSHFVSRLYGPCRGPRLTNETTGQSLTFASELALAAGEYLEVDTANRTAFLASNGDASRLNYLDFLTSSWWRLAPGVNQVRYHPTSEVDVGCAAYTTYLPAWLWL